MSFRCFSVADRRLPAGKPALRHAPTCANGSAECRLDPPSLKLRRAGAGGPKFHSAWPLAERYEALLRVFANPAPFARRLAARLHALPHRFNEALRLPKRRRERKSGDPADIPDLIGRESFERLEDAALTARPAFAPNSS